MKVALTEHIDRSEDKRLLRGTVGIVHSWVWEEGWQRPSVVYLKFEGAKWQLEGVSEPGVYPIVARAADWWLDKGRKVKVLKVKRTQLPLTPAYAMTAHASQGKTLVAVLLDLNVDKKMDPTIGPVAATRVRSRHDVLILRPFPDWLFQRTASDGPELLLQKLRGEVIDWAAYREARKPTASCQKCRQLLPLDAFEHKQWERVRANNLASCMTCWQGKPPSHRRRLEPDSLEKINCCGCNTIKIAAAFPRAQLAQLCADVTRQCLKCLQAKRSEGMQCRRCLETKTQEYFKPAMVTMPAAGILCMACQGKVSQQQINRQRKGFFKCKACRDIFPNEVATGKERQQICCNCASRETSDRQRGAQTCRNKQCKRKFSDGCADKDGKRQRYCPECRQR